MQNAMSRSFSASHCAASANLTNPVNPSNLVNALSITALLEHNEAFMRLRPGIEQITKLEHVLTTLLPDYLVPNVSVGPIKEGILTLFTTHSAFATRLRHLKPRLTEALQQRGEPVQELKIRVQQQQHMMQPQLSSPRKKAPLSAMVLMHLQKLSEQLAPSPLQTALKRMVAHHASCTECTEHTESSYSHSKIHR